jgi:adenine specific DNA methylase Mod
LLLFGELKKHPNPKIAILVNSFVEFICNRNEMMAYLVNMTARLIPLKQALKPTGSIFLHCDPTASHYLKIVMDVIFDKVNFRNEIAWCYDTGGRDKRYFPKKHDTIFCYSKSDEYKFYYENVELQRDTSTMHEPILQEEQGRPYQRNIKFGKEYRYYLEVISKPNVIHT